MNRRNRYEAVMKAGLRLKDCTQDDLLTNLLTNAGGFIVDMGTGGVDLITAGVIKVVSGSPSSYTSRGIKLDNGQKIEADAIVWCTGYEKDVRTELPHILGRGWEKIALKLEPTMGVDAEGEVRGLWKRLPGIDGFWVMGGGTAQHRWYSKMIGLQVKGMLEGVLPEAFRGERVG